MLLQKHQSILKELDLKYFKSFIEDSPKFLEIFLKRSPEDIIKVGHYIPEISKDFNEYTEINDRPILKFYCVSKIFDILFNESYIEER
jgi:hypothetical protein